MARKRTAVGEHIWSAEQGLERAVNGLSYARAALEASTLPWAAGSGSFVDFIQSTERDVRAILLKLREETDMLTSLYEQPPRSPGRRRTR